MKQMSQLTECYLVASSIEKIGKTITHNYCPYLAEFALILDTRVARSETTSFGVVNTDEVTHVSLIC